MKLKIRNENQKFAKVANIFAVVISILILSSGCASLPNVIMPNDKEVNIRVNENDIANALIERNLTAATELIFPNSLFDVCFDPNEMKVLVRTYWENENILKDPATIVFYDLEKKEILWSIRSFSWQPLFINDNIILQGSDKIFCINKQNGNVIWEKYGNYYFYDESLKLGFANLLTAFDFTSGQDKWHRDITNKFGWIERLKVDSLSMLCAVDGLHFIDLLNGNGWDIEMSTGKEDKLKQVFTNILITVGNVLSSMITGGSAPLIYYVDADIYTNMSSQLMIDNNDIYYTAKNNLLCIDLFTGQIEWSTILPDKKTAKTRLISNGDKIILINFGSCYKNGELIKYGYPYLSTFSKSSGEQLFYQQIDTEDQLLDYVTDSKSIYLLSVNSIFKYDLSDKYILQNKAINILHNNYGLPISFLEENISKNLFVKRGNEFTNLETVFNNSSLGVLFDRGVLILNRNLDIIDSIGINDLFIVESKELSGDFVLKNFFTKEYRNSLDEFLKPFKTVDMDKINNQDVIESIEKTKSILNNAYLIDNNNNYLGKVILPSPLLNSQMVLYYIDNNSIVFIEKPFIK